MAFSKRHYEQTARILSEQARMARAPHELSAVECVSSIQEAFSRMFAADNPRFDATRFDMACEPKEAQK